LKYYEALLDMGLFTRNQLVRLVGNPDTAGSLIRNYLMHGYITRIRHDLYAVRSLETRQALPDRFAIASYINDTSFVSHHSAFEYYGLANQVFNEMSVSSLKLFKTFEFEGVKYIDIPTRYSFGVTKPSRMIRVTDLERTIIDNIKDFSKHGGLEELLRCLALIPFTDEARLLSYLVQYDIQFLFQKTGYILSHFQKTMKLSDDFFLACKERVGKSVRYLYEGIPHESTVYNQEWQILTPLDLMGAIDEGADAVV
jgi:predicted transcriptional regulator of viral defense system